MSNTRGDRLSVTQRREHAADRQAASDKLSPKERLEQLDARLGGGKGAARERARLEAQL